MKRDKWCIKQAALLEMQYRCQPVFTYELHDGQYRCDFQHMETKDVQCFGHGHSEEDAFRAAIKVFVPKVSKERKLEDDNQNLRARLANLESQLASQSSAANEKPSRKNQKATEPDDAVSSGTF